MKIIVLFLHGDVVLPVDLNSGPQRLLFATNQAPFDAGCGHGDRYTVYYAERV